jgi:hypothetical protein
MLKYNIISNQNGVNSSLILLRVQMRTFSNTMNAPGALTVIPVNLTNMTVVCAFKKHTVIGTVVIADSACPDLLVLRPEYYSCNEV